MTDSLPPVYARLTIDTDALAANWRRCGQQRPKAECAAVVKADGYGLGIDNVVPALSRAGCGTFFVAQIDEGIRVRKLAPDATIYVLSGLAPGHGDRFAANALRPALGSREELREWSAFVAATGWQGGAALHVDTGMSRLGLRIDEAHALAAEGELFRPSLLMSHLACADTPEHPLNARQFEAFTGVRSLYPDVPASLCNSYGTFLPAEIGYDLLRPGVALYGSNPLPGQPNPMRPVITLSAQVLQVRNVLPGEYVGYGATWTSRQPARIAMVAIGYADGYMRSGSSSDDFDSALAYVAGKYCLIAGRISMDMTAIDVTDLPADTVKRGDWVELIGPNLPVDEVARRAGTIGYEILTSLGTRYDRHLAV
ncbi:alanine racemase [Labrys sp. ZIDIC5]|uniref:alanine racemase n=1 Tax=Labrys sedimenti TaxID=3106036 RepID=UPI002ACA2D5F|nr:alanine racemase [Labrys sp. ZIDIC5]MDZ5448682.1 alanine racemase [Labrys sp. ZIDIC5]